MSYSKDRDEFISIATTEGLPLDVARKLLRYARTLHRLAEAQCNGDWPYNGDRDRPTDGQRVRWDKNYVVCPCCESSGVSRYTLRWSKDRKENVCPDCRTAELVHKALPQGYEAIVNGDPRGAVLKIKVLSGRTNDWGREGIYVPTR